MDGKLIGTSFVVLTALLMTPPIMFGWYRFIRSAETARVVSALTIMIGSPLVAFLTIFWRWNIDEFGDSPAAGIPAVVAVIEMFWIWCASLLVLFLLHGLIANFSEKLRAQKEVDSEIFE